MPRLNFRWVAAPIFRHLITSIVLAAGLLSYTVTQATSEDRIGFDLTNYQGKVVYLDFWASWCGPCHQSFPVMNELQKQFGDDLIIVAVNVDEKREEADAFLELYKPDFDIVFDPQGTLAATYNVPTMPTSFLFSRQGELIKVHRAFRMDMVPDIKVSIEQAVN